MALERRYGPGMAQDASDEPGLLMENDGSVWVVDTNGARTMLPGTGSGGGAWFNGSGAPAGGLGSNGDYYLDDATGNVYTKASGSWSIVANIAGPQGIQGIQGIPGTDGTDGAPGGKWYASDVTHPDPGDVPSPHDGDMFVYTNSGDTYSYYSGSWHYEGPLPAGAPGSVWRNGSGVPANSLGINGDYYLDDDTGNVYLKAAGAYSLVANIKGPTGPTDYDGGNASSVYGGAIIIDGGNA